MVVVVVVVVVFAFVINEILQCVLVMEKFCFEINVDMVFGALPLVYTPNQSLVNRWPLQMHLQIAIECAIVRSVHLSDT